MNIHPVLLWTDILIYFLALGIVFFVRWASRQIQFRMAWQQVLRNPLAVISLLVLSLYVGVGLTDSIHFRITGNSQQITAVKSVFDVLVSPLGEREEKTYSAPFATQLYSKESIILSNGTQIRDYPRLAYGGADLKYPESQRSFDIVERCLKASLAALLIWAMIAVFALFFRKGRVKKSTFSVVLITIGVLLLLVFNAFALEWEYHILGTNKVGQDVFYEALKSIRTGLVIGTLTTMVIMPFAVIFGMLAGFFRGWMDDVIQYVYTTLSSIPDVLLIAAAILALQIFLANHVDIFPNLIQRADMRLLALCIILGITSWTNLCRLLRGETLKLRELDYVQAAHALGVKNGTILKRHILPNLMHLILIAVVMDFSGLVLAEAILTYVGVGVDPTTISWGNMINAARQELAREPIVWWPLLAAFIFMFPLVIAANLFSDAVRDALDPRIRFRYRKF